MFFVLFYLYIYSSDLQESDGGAIHQASNFRDVLSKMPILYCCPVEIFYFLFLILLRYD